MDQRLRDAESRLRIAHVAYLPYLNQPESPEKQQCQREYWTAEESARSSVYFNGGTRMIFLSQSLTPIVYSTIHLS
jgi:hypothetical protein